MHYHERIERGDDAVVAHISCIVVCAGGCDPERDRGVGGSEVSVAVEVAAEWFVMRHDHRSRGKPCAVPAHESTSSTASMPAPRIVRRTVRESITGICLIITIISRMLPLTITTSHKTLHITILPVSASIAAIRLRLTSPAQPNAARFPVIAVLPELHQGTCCNFSCTHRFSSVSADTPLFLARDRTSSDSLRSNA